MLPRATIDTTVLPPGDRFGMWLDLVARTSAPLRIQSAHSDDFAARADFLDLGPIQLVQYEYPSLDATRTGSWSVSPTRSCTSSPSPPEASARPARTVGAARSWPVSSPSTTRPGRTTSATTRPSRIEPGHLDHHADPARRPAPATTADGRPLRRPDVRQRGHRGAAGAVPAPGDRAPRAVPCRRHQPAGRGGARPGHHHARPAPRRRGRRAHRGPPPGAAHPGAVLHPPPPRRGDTQPTTGRRRRPPHLGAVPAPVVRGRGQHCGVVHPGPAAGPVPARPDRPGAAQPAGAGRRSAVRSDKAHFSRAFRAVYGTTPQEHRDSGSDLARIVNRQASTVNSLPAD